MSTLKEDLVTLRDLHDFLDRSAMRGAKALSRLIRIGEALAGLSETQIAWLHELAVNGADESERYCKMGHGHRYGAHVAPYRALATALEACR